MYRWVTNSYTAAYKNQILGTECLFKHQDLQMLDLKLNKYN